MFAKTLSRGVSMMGRVVDAADAPVAGVKVFANIEDYSGNISSSPTLSGPDGRFVLAGLRADFPHFVQVAASGHGRIHRFVGASPGPSLDLGDLRLPAGR